MVSTSVPGIHGWGNPCHLALPGALRLSPFYGRGLRAPFLFGRVIAGNVRLCAMHVGLSPVRERTQGILEPESGLGTASGSLAPGTYRLELKVMLGSMAGRKEVTHSQEFVVMQ